MSRELDPNYGGYSSMTIAAKSNVAALHEVGTFDGTGEATDDKRSIILRKFDLAWILGGKAEQIPTNYCGNGTVDTGESCDPATTCPQTCDDSDACTEDSMQGTILECTAQCTHVPVTACKNQDGCCPAGCAGQDSDCSSTDAGNDSSVLVDSGKSDAAIVDSSQTDGNSSAVVVDGASDVGASDSNKDGELKDQSTGEATDVIVQSGADGSGCGCQAAGAKPSVSFLLGLLLLAGARCRRKDTGRNTAC
jgi:MYXO-CTERM domain-containing protein